MREEEEWAAREEARRLEVEGLKAELEAVKRVVEGSGGVDGKLSISCLRWISLHQLAVEGVAPATICVDKNYLVYSV